MIKDLRICFDFTDRGEEPFKMGEGGPARSGQTNGQKNEWPFFMANGHLAIHHNQDSISGEWPWPFTVNRILFWRMASQYKIRIF